MKNKKLSEVFSGDDLNIQDLAQSADLIDSWLDGAEIDLELLGYMNIHLGSRINRYLKPEFIRV